MNSKLNRFKDTFPTIVEFNAKVVEPIRTVIGDVEWLKKQPKYYSMELIYEVLYNAYGERIQYHKNKEFVGYFKNLFIQVTPTFFSRVSNLIGDELAKLQDNSQVGKGSVVSSNTRRDESTSPYNSIVNEDVTTSDNVEGVKYTMQTDTENLIENARRLASVKISGEITKYVGSFSQLFTSINLYEDDVVASDYVVQSIDDIILALNKLITDVNGKQSELGLKLIRNNNTGKDDVYKVDGMFSSKNSSGDRQFAIDDDHLIDKGIFDKGISEVNTKIVDTNSKIVETNSKIVETNTKIVEGDAKLANRELSNLVNHGDVVLKTSDREPYWKGIDVLHDNLAAYIGKQVRVVADRPYTMELTGFLNGYKATASEEYSIGISQVIVHGATTHTITWHTDTSDAIYIKSAKGNVEHYNMFTNVSMYVYDHGTFTDHHVIGEKSHV